MQPSSGDRSNGTAVDFFSLMVQGLVGAVILAHGSVLKSLAMIGLAETAILGAHWPQLLFGSAAGPTPDTPAELAWRRADGTLATLEISTSRVIDEDSGTGTHAGTGTMRRAG